MGFWLLLRNGIKAYKNKWDSSFWMWPNKSSLLTNYRSNISQLQIHSSFRFSLNWLDFRGNFCVLLETSLTIVFFFQTRSNCLCFEDSSSPKHNRMNLWQHHLYSFQGMDGDVDSKPEWKRTNSIINMS